MVARWPLRRGATAAEVADPVYDIDATVVRNPPPVRHPVRHPVPHPV